MKHFILFILGLTALSASAQNELMLHINHRMGTESFAMNQSINFAGYLMNYNRVQYYLSDFTVVHDGGQSTFLEETFLLVDASSDVSYSLGEWDINEVESISFSVGVDEAHNHLDPATYDSSHPLAPQFPSMHWGWASGYRFVAAEGITGAGMNLTWQIHALGNENYFTQSHDAQGMAVNQQVDLYLEADYTRMFDGFNISSGLVEHSTVNEAATLLENMRDVVFSVGEPVSVSVEDAPSLFVFPNPVDRELTLVNAPVGSTLLLVDISGRSVENRVIANQIEKLETGRLEEGIYFLQILESNRKETHRIVIRH